MQHPFVKFVVNLSIVSEVLSSIIIKLTQDALKELIEINCCMYYREVATHLNVPLQDKLVLVLDLVIKIEELVTVFPFNQQGVIILGFVVRCVCFCQPFDSQAIPLHYQISVFSKTSYYLQKIVSSRSCCMSRNFFYWPG